MKRRNPKIVNAINIDVSGNCACFDFTKESPDEFIKKNPFTQGI